MIILSLTKIFNDKHVSFCLCVSFCFVKIVKKKTTKVCGPFVAKQSFIKNIVSRAILTAVILILTGYYYRLKFESFTPVQTSAKGYQLFPNKKRFSCVLTN